MVLQYESRKPRRRRNRRRGRGRKLATLATVKRLISGQEETKRYWVGMGDFLPGSQRVYACNPFRDLTVGNLSYQRVSDEIHNIKLHVAATWTAFGNDVTNTTRLTTGVPLRCMIVRTRNEISGLTGVGWTQITTNASTGSGGTQLPIFANIVQTASSLIVPHPDYKVVKQFWLKSEQPTTSLISGTTVFKQATVSIPKYMYDPLVGTGSSRGFNYYLVITTSGSAQVPDNSTNGSFQCHYMITFKDA